MLIQLIYLSAATHDFTSTELTELLTNSRLKNQILGITGMLVHHQGDFLQILEGEAATVDQLYRRIAADARHERCEMILRSSIDRRSFGEWRMGFVNTNEYRNTTRLPGYQDLERLQLTKSDPVLAYKLLMNFRDGVLRKAAPTEEPISL